MGERLRVVARRHGDDAASPLLSRQGQQLVAGAAVLERRGELEVLELHIDVGTGDRRQRDGVRGRCGTTDPAMRSAAASTSAAVTASVCVGRAIAGSYASPLSASLRSEAMAPAPAVPTCTSRRPKGRPQVQVRGIAARCAPGGALRRGPSPTRSPLRRRRRVGSLPRPARGGVARSARRSRDPAPIRARCEPRSSGRSGRTRGAGPRARCRARGRGRPRRCG